MLRAFFTLSKSEQRGIIILIILILIIGIANLFLPYLIESQSESNLKKYHSEIEFFLEEQKLIADSINIEILQNSGDIDLEIALQKITPFTFDPNKLPVEAWKKMGFTESQIRTIKNYEAKGGKFRQKEDLKKIYSISDTEFNIIEPYIVIPSPYKSTPGKVVNKKKVIDEVDYNIIEINNADSTELINSLGFSPWLAKRTLAYGKLLGGFIAADQLKEVYGLSDSFYDKIEQYVTADTNLVKKIDINKIEFKELLKHPYFDYNTTKSFFNLRNKIGLFTDVNQIKMVDGINDSTFNKVSYYLYIRP